MSLSQAYSRLLNIYENTIFNLISVFIEKEENYCLEGKSTFICNIYSSIITSLFIK